MNSAVAALDCGSNSTRLLIVDVSGETLVRRSEITRLSEGVDESGQLDEAAIERTRVVLSDYRREMDAVGTSRGILVATSAVRDAQNGDEFLRVAQAAVGVPAKTISGLEEATLSYRGAVADLVSDGRPTLVVDVGGGSTELAVDVGGTVHGFSTQLGCVRLTERIWGDGRYDAARDAKARATIEDELDRADRSVSAFASVAGRARMVGLAGTVATLVALDVGLVTYDRRVIHHHVVTRDRVQWWRDCLSTESHHERLAHPGMTPGREDILVAGLYVLDAVMARYELEEFTSSESDILDALCAELLTA